MNLCKYVWQLNTGYSKVEKCNFSVNTSAIVWPLYFQLFHNILYKEFLGLTNANMQESQLRCPLWAVIRQIFSRETFIHWALNAGSFIEIFSSCPVPNLPNIYWFYLGFLVHAIFTVFSPTLFPKIELESALKVNHGATLEFNFNNKVKKNKGREKGSDRANLVHCQPGA